MVQGVVSAYPYVSSSLQNLGTAFRAWLKVRGLEDKAHNVVSRVKERNSIAGLQNRLKELLHFTKINPCNFCLNLSDFSTVSKEKSVKFSVGNALNSLGKKAVC